MEAIKHLSVTELEAGMPYIRQSPKDDGTLKMIVRRPGVDEREEIERGELDLSEGLVGDSWKARSKHTASETVNVDRQITIMNSRVIELIACEEKRWSLAGDQLYIDLDLSDENLPPGTRLAIGSAVLEVSNLPHTGCKKFSSRYGMDAMKFVNSPEGRQLHLRGINMRVVQSGTIRLGDRVRKVDDMLNE
ncbi:MAG TPA: MOSC domain-containing protein [Anaerolineales bacterium]|nr:MOSC domain-containing protein [Anaerolineales bacterium]